MAFCIKPELAAILKAAAIRGEFDIAKMYEMKSSQRRDLFKKYTDDSTATEINAGFEKAMISSNVTALQSWAKRTFSSGEKKTAKYRDVIDKINELEQMGVLDGEKHQNFLSDLVATKLGTTVTSDEAKAISDRAKKLEELSSGVSEFGTPTLEYFKARKEMDNYLNSITPSSSMKVLSSTISRGTMLFSIKSPLLNIESNAIHGFLQAAERRLSQWKFMGSNNKYARQYMRFVNKVYQASGYDVSRLHTLGDLSQKTLGEERVSAQGKGKIRKIGRFYEDLVFKQFLGAPDVAFSAAHFADSANLASALIAKKEGLRGTKARERALTIFKDATRIDPQTEEGKWVRSQAVADAEYGTYTNDSVYADIGLQIRKVFNLPSKDLRVGDNIMPFVKTPANVIGSGIESSGVLIPVSATVRMVNGLKAISKGESVKDAFGDNFKGFGKLMIRAGLGLTFAYLLSTLFKPEDFIGEYPVSEKERQLLALKNATTNSVKIGNKWVSLDYFGALGAPLVGMLYARKYGKNLPEAIYYYYRGVGRQATKIPGFTEFGNMVQGFNENFSDTTNTLEDNLKVIANGSIDFVRARLIPAFVNDLAKATDEYERATGKDAWGRTKASIPGVRQTLPEKKTVLGDSIKSEGWMTVLTGARMKTASESPTVQELIRLESTGNLPSITDVSKTSDRAKQLKEQVGNEKFDQFMGEFTGLFKQRLERFMDSSSYQRLPDEEKKKQIDSLKNEAFDRMLKKYRYRKPRE